MQTPTEERRGHQIPSSWDTGCCVHPSNLVMGIFFFLKFRSLQKYQELLIPEPSLLYFKFEILFISFAFVPHSPPIGPVSKASLPPIFRVSDLDSLVEKRTPLLYYGL